MASLTSYLKRAIVCNNHFRQINKIKMKKVTRITGKSTNLIDDLSHKYIPYWPLLVMLAVPCLMATWVYLKFKAPVYEIAATIQVKDEKKGVDQDQVTSSINVLAPKSIVENE